MCIYLFSSNYSNFWKLFSINNNRYVFKMINLQYIYLYIYIHIRPYIQNENNVHLKHIDILVIDYHITQ